MKHAVRHKLASRRGASLSMALMLMLVCVTVAGITITAATVVTGRQAQLSETDQSYYNVTSAASVFWDELEGIKDTPLEIDRTCTGTVNPDGTVANHANLSTSFSPTTLFEKLSFDLVYGRTSTSTDLTASRVASVEMLENSIDWDTGLAKLFAIDETPYDPFEVGIADHEVIVTITPRTDGNFEFFFEDKTPEGEDSLTTCTLVASAGVTMLPPTQSSADQVTWQTTVTWSPMFMRMGGA